MLMNTDSVGDIEELALIPLFHYPSPFQSMHLKKSFSLVYKAQHVLAPDYFCDFSSPLAHALCPQGTAPWPMTGLQSALSLFTVPSPLVFSQNSLLISRSLPVPFSLKKLSSESIKSPDFNFLHCTNCSYKTLHW